MYGRLSAVPRPTTGAAVTGTPSSSAASSQGADSQSVLVTFLTFIGFYVVWALIERHEAVDNAIRPSNVALNVRTFAAIGLTAIIAINLWKVAVVKMAGWGIPGMHAVAAFVGNA